MTHRPSHLAMLWLVAASILVQSLWAGVPGGLSLCIGCDEGGWSLAQAGEPVNGAACCAGDPEPSGPADQTVAARCETGACDCIRIPMRTAPDLTLVAPRAGAPTTTTVLPLHVVAFLPLAHEPPSARHARPPRAGPSTPPRLLTPMSRCTVLLL